MNTYQKFLQKKHPVRNITDFRDLIYGAAEQYAQETAFNLRHRQITHKEFKEDYRALCIAWLSMGYAGKSIAITGENSYRWILAYVAAATIGVAVPIDKELSAEDIENFMRAAECVAIAGDDKLLKKINAPKKIALPDETKLEDVRMVSDFVKQGKRMYKEGDTAFDTMPINPDEMHILLFTSGTTGNEKGVCLSQTNICRNIRSTAQMVEINPSRRTLSVLPIHHTYESTLGHLLILSGGGCISYSDGLRYVGKNIAEYQPSVVIAVPLLLEFMLRTINKSVRKGLPEKYTRKDCTLDELLASLPWFLRLIVKKKVKKSLGGKLNLLIVGAAAVKPEVIRSFAALGITVYQGYGLTECAPLLAGNNDFFVNVDSTGLPIHGVELKIENPNEEGIGEIIAKGENIMLGYYKDPETTAEVMRDGWFHTGDLGYIDEDGWLYITGRCKNVIVTRNGKNIYPEELETRLLEHALVEETIVVGTTSLKGDDISVKAKIFPSLDAFKEKYGGTIPAWELIEKDLEELVDGVNDKMPHYKRISVIDVLREPFEKTTTKKIKRYGANME